MKAERLRELTDEELQQAHNDATKEVVNLRQKKGMGDNSEQPLRIRTLRRELARIKTVIRQRELKK
jgi:large subunit ribosomal protein L29